MPQSKQKIPILDAFRFLSSTLVVLVHYEIIFGHFVAYGAFATTAVSWFFVVSGFILSYTYPSLDSPQDYRHFYLHRVIRIYPVYFLAVLTSVLFVWIGYSLHGEGFFAEVHRPFELRYDLPEEKDTAFWFVAALRHLTFTQSVGSVETIKLLFNGPLWSLVLEAYFYVCFPLLLLLLKPINSMGRIITALLVGYLIEFLLLQLFLPEAEQYNVMNFSQPVYTNPLIRGFEFVFGMLLFKAFALDSGVSRLGLMKFIPTLLSVLAYLAIIVIGERYVPYQYSSFFIAVPVVTLMVYALLKMHWYPTAGVVRFCGLLGGLSYVLYCFHWPVMEMLQYSDLLPESLPFPVHLVSVIALLMVFSWLVYRFVESPIRKKLYRRFD